MASQIDEANELLRQGNTREGLKLLEHAASGGNVEAMYQLGLIYYRGKIIPGDLRIAQDWLERADEGEHAKAPYYVGRIFTYCADNDVKGRSQFSSSDWNKEAMYWYERSAERGSHAAMARIGVNYFNGIGVEKSHALAYSYLTKAKLAGNLAAQGKIIRINLLFHNGISGFFLSFYQIFSAFWLVIKKSWNRQEMSDEDHKELFLI